MFNACWSIANHEIEGWVIKVKVIKVIKHFRIHILSYSIILKYFNIILYIHFCVPRILNDLNDLDLNDHELRLIITKSYPKVSYLWVTFCIFAGGKN